MTRRELERVYYLKRELKMWQERLAELQADIAMSPKILDGMPFQHTNETSDPTRIKAIRLAEVSSVIEGKICEIKIAVADVEHFIMSIDDPQLRMIIEYRCAKCLEWRDIAYRIGNDLTEDACRQSYHRFVKDLE